MKSVLITGVTGFIGRYVAREFAENGWRVIGTGTRAPENAPVEHLESYHQLTLPSQALGQIVEQAGPQVCVHCAGRASVGLSFNNPEADFSSSVEITFNLLNFLRIYAPKCRTVFLSSAAVYGNPEALPVSEDLNPRPISPYGFHKLMCETLCTEFFRIFGLPTIIVRIFSSYGVGLRRQVLWDLCLKAFTNSSLHLQGTGSESRDFIHVHDAARALYLLAEKAPGEAEVFNLGSGTETTIKQLAELIVAEIGNEISISFDGINPKGNPLNWKADIRRITELGFIPETPIEAGIKNLVNWCRMEIVEE